MPGVRAAHLDARALADLTRAEPADLLIIGGGIAGMCAALSAPPDARIVVLDKGESAAGSSPLAQGGMAAAVGPDDSPDLHAADTIAAGAGLCDDAVVKDLCAEGPGAVAWLLEQGAIFDRSADGALHLAREGAQSVARSVHAVDATGAEIVRALRIALRGRNVERVRARAHLIVRDRGRCLGAIADGVRYPASATMIATGGAGGLWGRTTNQPGATGDGIVLGYFAGAAIADLEFMQFHPTALAAGGLGQRVLLTEALRGDGAVLLDARGQRFVDELGPRSEVTRAILAQERVVLDARGVADLEQRYPTVVAAVRARGLDPLTEPIPVEPAAHYFIGGVVADAHGRSTLPGLFAAGEGATHGFHGANRVPGNSLIEAVVVGRRVGAQVRVGEARSLPDPRELPPIPELHVPEELPDILWNGAGPIRSFDTFAAASLRILELPPAPHVVLMRILLSVAERRTETRGVHARSDFPDLDPRLAHRYVIDAGSRGDGSVTSVSG